MEGWIKIYPKMTEWRWYRDTYTKCIFLHLLLTANYKDTPFLNTEVKRGQVLTSVSRLSKDLDIPEKTVRRKLDNLKNTGEICTKGTNRWTIITICNYESYQGSAKTGDRAEDQSNDQTDDRHNKNNRNKENIPLSLTRVSPIEDRQKSFYDSLLPFLNKYDKQMLRDFYDYWSEPDRSTKPKMRWEKEKTWSLERRLDRWKRMDEEKASKRTQQQSKPTKLDQYREVAKRLGIFQDDTEQRNSIDEQ